MEMEIHSDTEQFSPTEEAISPVPHQKLKRLKKSGTKAISSDCKSFDFEKLSEQDLNKEDDLASDPSSGGVDEENELSSGFEGLEVEEERGSAKRVLAFESVDDDEVEDMDECDLIRKLRIEELEKKKLAADEIEKDKDKDKEKKKKKRKERYDFDEIPAASVKMTKKERRERMDHLRVESQRLLRETRDAAFKPVPIVKKPISSVLEKIRKRKEEITERFVSMRAASFVDGDEKRSVEDRGKDVVSEMESEKTVASQNIADGLDDLENDPSHENSPSRDLSEGSTQAVEAPVDHDTQGVSSYTHMSDSIGEAQGKNPSSQLEEALSPSLLHMSLKLNAALPEDCSSDEEEDNDKENADPRVQRSFPTGDPVRAFVDEEAEEEDDSDNDVHRFKDDEEDEDDADDDLIDMIATGNEEKDTDIETRNQLHRKWLEQQDDDGTDKLMKRLKCGLDKTKTSLVQEDENEEDGVDKPGSNDEGEEDIPTSSAMRINIRKIKEMIPQMFTDKNDAYVSSDDEEMERNLVKQSLFHKIAHGAKLLSPSEDQSNKDIFDRIKKVNNAPENGRKAKASSASLRGGNINAPLKSSFLGRGTKHSLPPIQKTKSNMMRSFIFERDDSNSRGSISISESSSEAIPQEVRPTKTASAKYSSQKQSSFESTQQETETSSRSSLYEILKRSSLKSSCYTRDSVVEQTKSIFSAFKLEKKTMKKEFLRTL